MTKNDAGIRVLERNGHGHDCRRSAGNDAVLWKKQHENANGQAHSADGDRRGSHAGQPHDKDALSAGEKRAAADWLRLFFKNLKKYENSLDFASSFGIIIKLSLDGTASEYDT